MNNRSNKVMTTFVFCFYLFALGSFGIRARWVFILVLLSTTCVAFIKDGIRYAILGKLKRRLCCLYCLLTLLIMLPNARHESDVYNFFIFLSITTYVCMIAKVDYVEIEKIFKINIRMGIFFAIYVSFFRIFPNIYMSTVYRLLAPSVKELYVSLARFGYGLPIGNSYTFVGSTILLGILALVVKDITTNENSLKNRIYMLIMMIGQLLEGRKTEVFASLITIMFLYYYSKNKSSITIKSILKKSIYILFTLIIVIITLKMLSNANYLQRFTLMIERIMSSASGNAVDYSSGRFKLWNIALALFKEYPIFGAGWGQFANGGEGLGFDVTHSVSHNNFLQLLSETGIVGTSIIIAFLMSILHAFLISVKQSKKNKNFNEKNKVMIFSLGMFFNSMIVFWVEPNFYGPTFWYFLAIAIVFNEYAANEFDIAYNSKKQIY